MVYQCVRNACGDNVVFLHYAIQSEVRKFFGLLDLYHIHVRECEYKKT